MFRLHQTLSQNELIAGFIAPLASRGDSLQPRPVAIPVHAHDRPQRLSSRRRKSRVEVQIRGV